MARLKEISADGNISGTDTIHLGTVVLTGGSDAASLVVKDGGASGTVVLTIKAAIDTSVVVPLPKGGIALNTAYADVTGTAVKAYFAFE